MKNISSLLLVASAIAVASSVSAGQRPEGARGMAIVATDQVHCYGINECKGSADCKSMINGCQGTNSCKGHGYKNVSAKDCLNAGGTMSDMMSMNK